MHKFLFITGICCWVRSIGWLFQGPNKSTCWYNWWQGIFRFFNVYFWHIFFIQRLNCNIEQVMSLNKQLWTEVVYTQCNKRVLFHALVHTNWVFGFNTSTITAYNKLTILCFKRSIGNLHVCRRIWYSVRVESSGDLFGLCATNCLIYSIFERKEWKEFWTQVTIKLS